MMFNMKNIGDDNSSDYGYDRNDNKDKDDIT